MKFSLFILNILLYLDISEPARILCVFSVPYYSHQNVLKILPEELVKYGHQLVVLTPEPSQTPTENITQIDIKETAAEKWDEELEASVETDRFAIKPEDFHITATKFFIPVADTQFSVKEVQDLIKGDAEFDLIIAEDCTQVSFIIGARYKAPIVLLSSFYGLDGSFSLLESETNPILFQFFQKRPTSFWERMRTFLIFLKVKFALRLDGEYNALIKKNFGGDAMLVDEVRKNVKMLMLSVNHMWDNSRAITPSVTYMGAIHIQETRPLPEDLQIFLDNSTQGVIVMSFGSKTKSSDLPAKTLGKMIRVFQSLPYDVIWKWDGGHLENCPKNVRLEEWLPQADLLRHPSIKAFITHGGLQSTDEAIFAGVPLVGIPLMADQFRNVQKYRQYGIGVELDIDNLDEEEFRNAIVEVAEDRRYRDNIKRLRGIIWDQPTRGIDRAVGQIHRLLTHGPYPASDFTNFDYYAIDVLVLLAAILIVCFSAILLVVQLIMKCLDNVVVDVRNLPSVSYKAENKVFKSD